MRLIKSAMLIAFGAIVLESCSNSLGDAPSDLKDYQSQVYSKAFAEEFGNPASNQNWGFGSFALTPVTVPEGSPLYVEDESSSRAATRAVASEVKKINPHKYQKKEDVFADKTAYAYFYLRIDNKIQSKELQGVQGLPTNDYYPKDADLGNGVKDGRFSTDNEGAIYTDVFSSILTVDNNSGMSYATNNLPIPDELFAKEPSFETMANHVPDAEKIKLAGSVEAFNSDNFKIFWYVAKWQGSDKVIHVDGVLVPKDQITVNVPEYKKRIIVEDLKGNITVNTKVSTSDFDYNDVVFDAITWNLNGQNHLKIIVRAAGGQMPIYVAGKEIHQGGVGYMFNTSNPDYNFASVLVEDSIISSNASTFDFNSIPVEVEANGERLVAGSNIGQAPEKIAVDLDYKWCREKESIKTKYPRFIEYVGNKDITDWWKEE